jgi:predicted transcriptional regulator
MRQRYLPVEEKETLVRDTQSNAILNTDLEGLKAYRTQKRKFNEIERIKCDVDEIKCDIQEIKDMIRAISK